MALGQSALLELVKMLKASDGGERVRTILQALVDAEATAHIGAGMHERTDARTTQRIGTRDKLVTTAAGDLTITIPKVRTGSLFQGRGKVVFQQVRRRVTGRWGSRA